MSFTDSVNFNKSICMCCLAQNSPLYKLNYCKHLDFFDSIQMKLNELGKVVCYKCHSTLKKFASFKKMVIENFNSLDADKESHTSDLINMKENDLQIENVIQINISPFNFKTEECNNINNSIHSKVVNNTDNISVNNLNVSKKVDNIQTALSIISKNQNFFKVKPQIFEQIRDVVLSSDIITNILNQKNKRDSFYVESTSIDRHGINNDGEISATENKINVDNVMNIEGAIETSMTKDGIERIEEKLNEEMANITTIYLSIEELNAERLSQEQSIQYQNWEYKCEGCIIGFSYEENMRDHIKRRHTHYTGTVKCDICSQVYHESNRDTHIARHFTRYECKICSKRFAILDEARRHFILQHKERKYHCSLCTFKTSSMKMFTRHRARKCSETNANKIKRRKNKLKT